MSKQLGYMIRQFRERKSISQQELSEISGLSQSFISSIENNLKSPTIRSLKELAQALDISHEELVKTALFPEKYIDVIKKNNLITGLNASIAKLYKYVIGTGPKRITTDIYKDVVIIRLKPYVSPILEQLSKSSEGKNILSNLARYLFDSYKVEFNKILNEYIGIKVDNIYCDYSNINEILLINIFSEEIL
ncbi:DUF2294 family protein [Iocasia frigidifontis]|uniref:DUF2294 family protein n=1 Tax=Iocasia fonsfrigidae TaxID=2682810 RepID=A0A8A7KNZ0_9FIRM|nr:Na-translocating system protein MpsC family protein [Iocasia fonsfrigidae]QTL99532.1 DUF2294 family protein [Iocasia fonsfrigidae]